MNIQGRLFPQVLLLILPITTSWGQTITNGTFSNGSNGWGCTPEINHETTYGGVSNSNLVAEIDQGASLCQTITGFTVGAQYTLSFKCSRRTTCGPAVQTMNVSISNNVLNTTVSRNSTPYNLAPVTISFIPTSTTLTLTFTGVSPTTCGLTIDDVSIQLLSALSTTVDNFNIHCSSNKEVICSFEATNISESESFELEVSPDLTNYTILKHIDVSNAESMSGKFTIELNESDYSGISYYRVKTKSINGDYYVSNPIAFDASSCKANVMSYILNKKAGYHELNFTQSVNLKIYDLTGKCLYESSNLSTCHHIPEYLLRYNEILLIIGVNSSNSFSDFIFIN